MAYTLYVVNSAFLSSRKYSKVHFEQTNFQNVAVSGNISLLNVVIHRTDLCDFYFCGSWNGREKN